MCCTICLPLCRIHRITGLANSSAGYIYRINVAVSIGHVDVDHKYINGSEHREYMSHTGLTNVAGAITKLICFICSQ